MEPTLFVEKWKENPQPQQYFLSYLILDCCGFRITDCGSKPMA